MDPIKGGSAILRRRSLQKNQSDEPALTALARTAMRNPKMFWGSKDRPRDNLMPNGEKGYQRLRTSRTSPFKPSKMAGEQLSIGMLSFAWPITRTFVRVAEGYSEILRAGFPITDTFSGTFMMTVEPAPTVDHAPTFIFGITHA